MRIRLGLWFFLWVRTLTLSGQPLASFFEISELNPGLYTAHEARGVAVADYDNDGDDDFFVSANPCRLYRNDGNFQFTEVSLEAGINTAGRLALWFDADDDGDQDILISGYNKLRFFINNADGTFVEQKASGFTGTRMQVALMAGDLNGDGLLEVYANNFKIKNQLFFNYGNNQFRDAIEGTGASVDDQSMAGLLFDFDEDGDLDIYLTFDGYRPNKLFINDGKATFIETASAFKLDTRTQGMGVDMADFNRDGKIDFYITNLFENTLLIRTDTIFNDQAIAAGVADYGMGWGVVCFDYDNDGWTDIYVNNEYNFSPFTNKLYRNNQNGTFSDQAAGTNLENKRSGFGTATADFDNDGRLDLVVVNYGGDKPIRLFRNQLQALNQWVQFSLVGNSTNKFAIGSRLLVYQQGTVLQKDVLAGSGWYSQNSNRIHMGLGNNHEIDSVVVVWPNGQRARYVGFQGGNHYLIAEGHAPVSFSVSQFRSLLTAPSALVPFAAVPDKPIEIGPEFSIARIWNEALLEAIRNDFARPTVHARNLFHVSAAMYDAWAACEPGLNTFLLGKTNWGFHFDFSTFNSSANLDESRHEAISYAAFRLIKHRFAQSPGSSITLSQISKLFLTLGYNESLQSTKYETGKSYALGNYIAQRIIEFGMTDGSNEQEDYANLFYKPVNQPLKPEFPGNKSQRYPNRWQPLQLQSFIDQSGNEIGNSPPFLSPEWGKVAPFALRDKDLSIKFRDKNEFWIYHDPGPPPKLDTLSVSASSTLFQESFLLVSHWSSHLDPNDGAMIDISPASIGNVKAYPQNFPEHLSFYRPTGGDLGEGYSVNPKTGQPYSRQFVPRGDYTRVLAEFWADGPKSETPPGHWFTILNKVSYDPFFERKYKGAGGVLDPLEWDVKSYLALGGAMHDVAITAWGIKGYYDYVRPISAIRYMAEKGQSSNLNLPNYHPAGIPLIPGIAEQVLPGDPLAGPQGEHINKVKLFSWRGPAFIADPKTDVAGVDWILAENWWPYQRPTFVTPPFAGYISGHSTYSSAAAEVLTLLTGDEFFPGGMGEFLAPKNSYLVFERGPSVDVRLQWARYKDAADQCSLSRIWGGIHPPIDDFPGRSIGVQVGANAFQFSDHIFSGTWLGEQGVSIDPHIVLFPNPINQGNVLQLQSTLPVRRIRVFDSMGRQLSVQLPIRRSQYNIQMETRDLTPGLYIFQVDFGGRTKSAKITIR